MIRLTGKIHRDGRQYRSRRNDAGRNIELHLNTNGEGEGKMSYATRITADPESNTVILENWGTSPVLLQGVHREK